MNIERNKNLQALNTLAVPSKAEFYTAASTVEELQEALAWAQQKNIRIYVLGGGSNVLLADYIPGLIVHITMQGRDIKSSNAFQYVHLSAGENWHRAIEWMLAENCNGLENLALIPGTVGAAPVQNIGAYGVELADYFYKLSAVNIHNLERVDFYKSDCAFAYRDSLFKGKEKSNWVIVEIILQLPGKNIVNLDYPALQKALENIPHSNITPTVVFDAVCAIRASKLPAPEDIPNAGSFFKNPIVSQQQLQTLKEQWPDVVAFELGDNQYKLAAGWLIEQAGWKGKAGYACQMHHQQALVLCNPQKKSVGEVLNFAAEVQQDIKNKFAVDLEIEPQTLG